MRAFFVQNLTYKNKKERKMSKDLLISRVGKEEAGVIIDSLINAPGKVSKYKMEEYLKDKHENYSLCGGETRSLMEEVKGVGVLSDRQTINKMVSKTNFLLEALHYQRGLGLSPMVLIWLRDLTELAVMSRTTSENHYMKNYLSVIEKYNDKKETE